MSRLNETTQRVPRQETHAGPRTLTLVREPERPEVYAPPRGAALSGERVWLALAFVVGVSTRELRAAVAAYPRPLVELKGILAEAREELEAGGDA